MEKIGRQRGMHRRAGGYGTDRGRFQIKKADGRESHEYDFPLESLAGINGLAALLKGQEGLDDIERGEPWKVTAAAIKTEQKIPLIIQGNMHSLHLEAIFLHHHRVIRGKVLKYGHAQGGNPAAAVGKGQGKGTVDAVGGRRDGNVAETVAAFCQDLYGRLRGNVRRSGLPRWILQGQGDAVDQRSLPGGLRAVLATQSDGQEGMTVFLQGFSQQRVILHSVDRGFCENDIKGYRSGAGQSAELHDRGIHLPRPGPMDPLLLGSLQTALIDDHQDNLLRSWRMCRFQAAEMIVGSELVGFKEICKVKNRNENAGQDPDGGPGQDFGFAAG